MTFELGKTYIVDVTEKGIIPQEVFDRDRWYHKDYDDLDFLTDEEKIVVINDVLDKIRAEINQLPSYRAKFADGDSAIHINKEKALHIIDKYKTERE